MKKLLVLALLMLSLPLANATTWYVRPGGGTRYNAHGAPATFGQCDGLADTDYTGTTNAVWVLGATVAPGTTITDNRGFYETTSGGGTSGLTIPVWGVTTTTDGSVTWTKGAAYPQNGHCAFSDPRYLWADGEYSGGGALPQWGWTIAGGDTVIIRGAHTQSTSYRIGYSGPNNTSADYFLGQAGSPGGSGPPAIPSGTLGSPTLILGENYASCTSPSAKTFVHAGYGANAAFNFTAKSYVQVKCINISDQSSCGRFGTVNNCHTSFPLDDYANNGITMTNASNNITIQDVDIHGMASSCMLGAPGDAVTLNRVSMVGCDVSGWNMDDGSSTTGIGHTSLSYLTVAWNGCDEEYPIVDALPYNFCSDDLSGGYGDGIGTTTATSLGIWNITLDHSDIHYNTEDGFDGLHVKGVAGTSVTVTNSLFYGNKGNQIKVGGSAPTLRNNLVYDTCNALRQAIPGTPAGYNTHLSDFCRAGDDAIATLIDDSYTSNYQFNTVVGAGSGAWLITCATTCTHPAVNFNNNVMLGFLNNATNGYPGGGSGNYMERIYYDPTVTQGAGIWLNTGSSFSYNDTFHEKNACPNTNETHALCVDPQLTSSAWVLYGYNPMTLASGSSPPVGAGLTIAGVTTDYLGNVRPNPPAIGAYQFGGSPPTLTSITVLPNPASVTTGGTVNMQTNSFCTFSDSSTIAAGLTGCVVVWSDTNAHSSINASTGGLTGISAGSDTITAALGITGTAAADISGVVVPPTQLTGTMTFTGNIKLP